MRGIRNSYFIDRSKRSHLTTFEADLVRYLHISDCNVMAKVIKEYWTFCPVCCAKYDEDGVAEHRARRDIEC